MKGNTMNNSTKCICSVEMAYGRGELKAWQGSKDIRTLGTFKRWHKLNVDAYGYQSMSRFNSFHDNSLNGSEWTFWGEYYVNGLRNEYRWTVKPV